MTKYSDTLVRGAGGHVCPICGKASYSRGGVHPQCSLKAADEKTAVLLRAARKQAEMDAKP